MIISIITQMCKKERMGSGMQSKGVHQISNNIVTALKEYFNDRIEGFTIYNITDIPYPMFSIRFTLYNYYKIVYNYDRGRNGFSISIGRDGIGLKHSQPWFDDIDLGVLCKELDENVRIRIPNKYLAYYNW